MNTNRPDSFKLNMIDMSSQEIRMTVHERFTYHLARHLKKSDNPAIQALGHQIAHAGMVMNGADPSKFEDIQHVPLMNVQTETVEAPAVADEVYAE